MKKHIKISLSIGILGALLSSPLISANLIHDQFLGTELDTEKWSVSGWGTSRGSIGVADSNLSMVRNYPNTANPGSNDHISLRSADSSALNFHQGPLSANIGIVSFNEPAWGSEQVGTSSHGIMWFSIGPETSTANIAAEPLNGFSLPIVWRLSEGPGVIYLGGEGTAVPKTYISGVPSEVSFSVDIDSFEISLAGATFTSGDAAGTATLFGSHSIDPQAAYMFQFGIRNDGGANTSPDHNNPLIGVFSEVAVIPEPSTYATLFGMLAAGFILLRRKSRK